METIQEQIVAMQEEIKRLREELKEVKKGNFDTITCRGWSVVDADGTIRIAAEAIEREQEETEAVVRWFDESGKERIKAGTGTILSWVLMNDDYGHERISATAYDGMAEVSVCDKNGKQRIAAATYYDGHASVQWKDKDGTIRIAAATLANGNAIMQLLDRDETRRIMAATLADGTVDLPTQDVRP